ncbi:hypothetical protein [Streptomyces tendae]|uniref:hypothetical protein n=1 Tax=Streptomyces tendae TaxID=1932 RepID=UPI003D7061F3
MPESGGWGTLTVGRLALREVFQVSESGGEKRTLSVSGQEASPPLTRQQLVDRHDDLLALEGAVLPVTFEDKPERNGYYLVTGATADLTEWKDEVLTSDWKLDLTRAGTENETDLQSRLTGAARQNDFSLTGERWHAPPIGHYGYFTGSTAPSVLTRTGADGAITVYRGIPANVSPRWGCSPSAYMAGRVRFTTNTGREVTGTDRLLAATGWSLGNGLVSVGPGSGTTLAVQSYAGSSWFTKQWNVTADSVLTGWDSASLLHNEPEHVVVRLMKSSVPGRVTLDLSLRRGSRVIEGFLKTGASSTLSVSLATPEGPTSTVSSGYVTAASEDADGNAFLAGSARTFTGHADGGGTRSSTTSLDFFLGLVGGQPVLNPNPYFETNVSGWQAVGCTIAQSTDFAHQGTASMKLTPDGVTATPLSAMTTIQAAPVPGGVSHWGTGWLYSPVGHPTVNLAIDWLNASNTLLLTTQGTISDLPAGAWTFFTVSATSPFSATKACLKVRMPGTPASSVVLYADEMKIRATPPSGEAATDLRNQYIASMPEAVYPVRR